MSARAAPDVSEIAARPLAVAVVWDEAERASANLNKRNYWYAYVWEMLDRLGITASPIAPSALTSLRRLQRFGSIIIGGLPAKRLSRQAPTQLAARFLSSGRVSSTTQPMAQGGGEALSAWVRGGGTLIGFASEGLDEVFGISPRAPVAQRRGEFAITGYFELVREALTQGIHSPLEPEQRLIIISPLRPVKALNSREVARFFSPHPTAPENGARARDTGLAVVTARRLGSGWAFYFGFDLPHTIWALQQGRPIDRDYDGDGYLRFGDAMVIGKNTPRVPYSDELMLLLQQMLARQPVPMVHQLPAQDGRVPDALFHFGGDDECEPGIQVSASEFMKSRRLPYHINLMPVKGRFAITREESRRILANGHELSLHYNFMDGFAHPGPFAEKDVREQAALFHKAFGRAPVCSVSHCCRWTGWAEPAKWMLAAGGKADNSRVNWPYPPYNPVNHIGFAFGTAFPYFFRDDWRSGNARIPFLQIPIVSYEIGYEGDRVDFGLLRCSVDLAARYHLTMNMFYHPVYLGRYPACRRAIDELLRCLRTRRLRAMFMGTDELWRWWWDRSKARIQEGHATEGGVSFRARCCYPGGFVVKLPVSHEKPRRCWVDGKRTRFHIERRLGQTWVLVPLPPGQHKVVVKEEAQALIAG
jgi:hypothetical protein